MLSMYYHELSMLACFMSCKLTTSHMICCKVHVCHVVLPYTSYCTTLFVISYMFVCHVVLACVCVSCLAESHYV